MAEKCIELDSVEIAAAVFGNCDRNIRLLEKEFSVTAVCRGTQLRISGEPANVAAANRAVEGMLLLIENRTPLEDQTVHYCISLAHDGAEKRVKELTEDFVTVTVKGRPIRPKTLGQKEYLSAIRSNAITFGVGPAGTAVELASGSSIALYGSGFDLEAGKTIQLIKSDKGIVKDGKALDKGDSLDDLKGDLTVIDIKSLIRATETGFSKDQYDLSMKTEELLIATLKEKAPAPTPDPDPDPDPNPDPKPNPDPVPEPDRPSGDKVNDQTNALMQSSIAAAATMFAADELLIDTTMKSRQGVRQTGPFAAARVGRYDLDVRGDLETNVI